jgi:adenylate cyclase, class 2
MKEIEAKILEVNTNNVIATLLHLGAKKVFDGQIETSIFDFQNKAIVKAKDLLRLRRQGDKTQLTYKKVHVTQTAKVAEEYTVEISDIETMKRVLEFLGLKVTENLQKHRVSYVLGKTRFEIDRYMGKYSYIPEFMEIEAENTQTLHRNAELLGFKSSDCLPWSTHDLIKYYSTKKIDSR